MREQKSPFFLIFKAKENMLPGLSFIYFFFFLVLVNLMY